MRCKSLVKILVIILALTRLGLLAYSVLNNWESVKGLFFLYLIIVIGEVVLVLLAVGLSRVSRFDREEEEDYQDLLKNPPLNGYQRAMKKIQEHPPGSAERFAAAARYYHRKRHSHPTESGDKA